MVSSRHHEGNRRRYLAAARGGLVALALLVAVPALGAEHRTHKGDGVGTKAQTETPQPNTVAAPKPYVYPYPCSPPQSAEQDNLCIQRAALDEAKNAGKWAKATFWTGVASAIGLFLTLIATAGAAIAAQRSAHAAERVIDQGHEFFQAENRPWVSINDPRIRKLVDPVDNSLQGVAIQFAVHNSGRLPAMNCYIHGNWLVQNGADDEVIPTVDNMIVICIARSRAGEGGGKIMLPNIDQFAPLSSPIPTHEYERWANRQARLFAVLTMTYRYPGQPTGSAAKATVFAVEFIPHAASDMLLVPGRPIEPDWFAAIQVPDKNRAD